MKKFLSGKLFKFIASTSVAALLYFICPECFSKTTLSIILVSLLFIINGSPFISKFTWITHVSRFLVGGLFIFSGWIKANDTVGFGYKLEEYFEVFKEATGWELFVENDKLCVNGDCTFNEAKAALDAHNPPAPTESTVSEKLASVGLSIEELKAALGGN